MKIKSGLIHRIPKELKSLLLSNKQLLLKWNNLTPIARNEWICWVTIVKKQDTKMNHLKRLEEEIMKDVKRPCCWAGCPHRNENSRKYFKNIK